MTPTREDVRYLMEEVQAAKRLLSRVCEQQTNLLGVIDKAITQFEQVEVQCDALELDSLTGDPVKMLRWDVETVSRDGHGSGVNSERGAV